jgi:hypothetical protein
MLMSKECMNSACRVGQYTFDIVNVLICNILFFGSGCTVEMLSAFGRWTMEKVLINVAVFSCPCH